MRIVLFILALVFLLIALVSLVAARSDIQLILAFQGLGFAVVFWSLAALRGQLMRIEAAARMPGAQRAVVEAVSEAVIR